jgi:hypothetical protein
MRIRPFFILCIFKRDCHVIQNAFGTPRNDRYMAQLFDRSLRAKRSNLLFEAATFNLSRVKEVIR